jgi:hypothetical protein
VLVFFAERRAKGFFAGIPSFVARMKRAAYGS